MTYLRETKEFQPIGVKVRRNGVESKVFDGVEFVLLLPGIRPSIEAPWANAIALDGEIGVMIDKFEHKSWNVFARITSAPEMPVVYCGNLTIS